MKRTAIFVAFAIWGMFAFAQVSQGHNFNNGYSYVRISGSVAEYELLLPFPILLQYDMNQDKRITDDELERQWDIIEAYLRERLLLFNGLARMDFELVSLESTIQEITEDPVVRFVMRYTSETDIEELTIRYGIILEDVDPTHQNYIQMYHNGKLVAHRVVGEEGTLFRWSPGAGARFGPAKLGQYALLGLQYMARNIGLWLIVLCLVLPSRDGRTSLRSVTVFAAGNMIGYILAFRTGRGLEEFFVTGGAMLVIGYLAVDNVIRKTLHLRNAVIGIYGLIHGLGTLEAVWRLGIYAEYKVVSLASYCAGILLGLAGVVYVLYVLAAPLRPYAWYRRVVGHASIFALFVGVIWFVAGSTVLAT
jgi:hypothetical protein